MTKYWNSILRKSAPILAAGMLLQAGGCSTNLGDAVSGIVTTAGTSLLSSVVFGAFGLAP